MTGLRCATPQDNLNQRVERLPQRQNLNFRHVHFLCEFGFLEGARRLHCTQSVRTLNPHVCLANARSSCNYLECLRPVLQSSGPGTGGEIAQPYICTPDMEQD